MSPIKHAPVWHRPVRTSISQIREAKRGFLVSRAEVVPRVTCLAATYTSEKTSENLTSERHRRISRGELLTYSRVHTKLSPNSMPLPRSDCANLKAAAARELVKIAYASLPLLPSISSSVCCDTCEAEVAVVHSCAQHLLHVRQERSQVKHEAGSTSTGKAQQPSLRCDQPW